MKEPSSASHSKLQIGIIGAGAIVRQRHLPALLKMPGVEVIAVSNSSYESADRFCREHVPGASPFKHWADLLSLDRLDAVLIGAPPYLHSTASISALEAGKHVFCQARMCMNLEEAQDMVEAAGNAPALVTMLCPPPHGLRGDRVMRKLLAEEAVGPIHAVRLRSLSGQYLSAEAPAHWRQRVELSGLNVLTLGIYAEVLQRWLGPIVAVQARARILYPDRDGYHVRIPDILNVLCAFESGAEAVMAFSGVAAGAPTDRLEIHGRDGTIAYDFSNDSITLAYAGNSELRPVEIPPELAAEWRVEEDFVGAIRGGGKVQPHPSFPEGLEYMRVVQAVADSVLSGSEIALQPGAFRSRR